MKWSCGIPGKGNTIWDPAVYPLTMEFTEDYPSKPPKCMRTTVIHCTTIITLFITHYLFLTELLHPHHSLYIFIAHHLLHIFIYYTELQYYYNVLHIITYYTQNYNTSFYTHY